MTIAIGMNLNSNTNGSTEAPFLDRMKTSDPWGCYDGTGVVLNQYGYPAGRVGGGAGEIHTAVALDPVSDAHDNFYHVLYEGTATISVGGSGDAQIAERVPGRMTFRKFSGTTQAIIVDSVSATDPLRNMRVVRRDQADLLDAGAVLNPDFVARLSPFGVLRYMEWGAAHNTTVSSWANRALVTENTWRGGTERPSVPIEVMIDVANATKTDMWVCVPRAADDDYVRQMMTMIRDRLNPALAVHVEYTNEAWNFGLAAFTYCKQQAEAKWGAGTSPLHYYGYRAAQVMMIARDVFAGQPLRLRCVIGAQADWQGPEAQTFEGVALATDKPVSAVFDEYTIAAYFGDIAAQPEDRDIVLGWARGGDAGLTAAIKAVATGEGLGARNMGLTAEARVWKAHAAVAAAHGLSLVGYEGGESVSAVYYPPAQQAEVLAFFVKIANDPRVGDLYADMVTAFEAAGGTLLCAFNDVGYPSIFGTFAMLSSIYDADSPRWAKLVALAKQRKAQAVASPTPVPSPTPTPTPAPAPAKAITKATALASLTAIDKATTAVRALVNGKTVDPTKVTAAIDVVSQVAQAARTVVAGYRR